MKIMFAGTPAFAAAALEALHAAGHTIALVLTQPDRPAGRGLQPTPSPVKALAQRLALPVSQPQTLRNPAAVAELASVDADVMVVAAYGLILPRDVLAVPRRGCINVHASLLPRWRGAAPIQRALLSGDQETGISIMRMDEGLDTGPVLLQAAIPVTPEDTARSLHDRLAALGADLIVRALTEWPEPRPQPESGVTYAAKIDKREARIDWREAADVNERKVRAFNPAPGASTTLRGLPLKIWRAKLAPAVRGAPGAVISADASGITVASGEGALTLTALQRAGGRRLDAGPFLAGCPLTPGERFGE